MKRYFPSVARKLIIIVLSLIVVGTICYLFIYDENKQQHYLPQLEYQFLKSEIQRLNSAKDDTVKEVDISHNGFKGILMYQVSESSEEEISLFLQNLSRNHYDGTHITFQDEHYEIFVGAARYTPLIKALGYGWWDKHTNSNLYAWVNGKEAAKGKPNYRNYFQFVIRKGAKKYSMIMFCNTDDVEKVFSEAINIINE